MKNFHLIGNNPRIGDGIKTFFKLSLAARLYEFADRNFNEQTGDNEFMFYVFSLLTSYTRFTTVPNANTRKMLKRFINYRIQNRQRLNSRPDEPEYRPFVYGNGNAAKRRINTISGVKRIESYIQS